eukprot:CAMPEP_0114363556 /NCGR_PEP_ID=MMETSP0101-20121206/26689_1 /TAXON_ID=38822 ORGANISM="Pteridomonas danica, Strain PT" /NCGR_SAMPLE_ID=MMETSP0101 /ASSEMBLY_ACC=CAM_ASM_000211 /LENGTH=197 /DNA_ID=CAMNT_0001510325 /DNA_START=18 /DNA_END=611 /DNA_ORIENTATION=-
MEFGTATDSSAPTGMKIIIIGPSGSGKTAISNYLAGQTNNDSLEAPATYNETKGVRILECERNLHGRGTKSLEIWDVSGNSSFESGWPAIMQHADGVILVYNPDKAGNDIEIGDWFDEFVKNNSRISDPVEQCLAFAHHSQTDNQGRHASKVPAKLKVARIGVVDTGFDSSSSTVVTQNFDDFLAKCSEVKAKKSKE